jgi:catechol 2,3-dioxygenase-like lactoylglutathione lyase family enzyme
MDKTFINPMFGGFYQIGFVTSDMDRSIDFFEKTMGVPKFLKLQNPVMRNQVLFGEPIER